MIIDPQYYNVPGNKEYRAELPLDVVITSTDDEKLRGYWLDRDDDGTLVFASNQNAQDYVYVEEDEDGIPTIVFDDELTQEFRFDGQESTISIQRAI